MSTTSISPIAPARIRTLLVPVGRITKSRFDSFVNRLYPESVVRLSDISPDTRPDRNLFSPLAFPTGVLLYNLTTALPPENHASLSPFETFRETLVVIGIADGQANGTDESDLERLEATMSVMHNDMPEVLFTHVLVFDVDGSTQLQPGMSPVPFKTQSNRTTIKTVMCDVSARFLGELVLFARKVQNSKAIDVPEVLSGHRNRDSAPVDFASQGSRPSTPLSVVGSNPDSSLASAGPSNMKPLPEPPRESISSQPDSPVHSPTASKASRAGSPDDWETATGSKIRPASSAGLPTQIKTASATDRAKNKLKARQSIILGTLFLHAGRWPDALRELSDGTTRARAFGDHAYHAKGLENVLVTMLLMAWAGLDFTIPSICQPIFKESRQRRSLSVNTFPSDARPSSDTQAKALTQLSTVIPDVLNTVCNALARPINIFGQKMPQISMSESITRLSFLYAALLRCGGLLNPLALNFLIHGAKPNPHAFGTQAMNIAKREVSAILFRAYPVLPPESTQAMFDASIILSEMSAVFSFLGMHRKRAVLIRDMLAMMVPGLIQARKVGAAEVGIHPAASLAALHGLSQESSGYSATMADGETEKGLRSLMLQLCSAYGLDIQDWVNSNPQKNGDEQEAVLTPTSLAMNLEVLRLCMNFAEALPNFKDVMWFAAHLLKITAPKYLPPIESGIQQVPIGVEEQIRIGTKIHRMLGVVKATDAELLSTNYWDPFLVRGIELSESSASKTLTSRTRSDFGGSGHIRNRAASITKHGPFIHDASLAVKRKTNTKQVTAAAQRSEFWVQLQNPFEFEITIDNISLITDGIGFSQRPQTVTVGPSRIQKTMVAGIAEEPGTLKISGCRIKVQGCREREFEIFGESWYPKAEIKTKTTGLRSLKSQHDQSVETQADRSEPKSKSVEIVVTDPQPVCALVSHSLSQSILTVLAGETQSFSITIRNVSDTVPVNFVYVSFEHSLRPTSDPELRGVAGQIQAFEIKEAAMARPPFRWRKSESSTDISPGSTTSYTIDVYGLYGMTEGTVHIDYAYLESHEDTDANFYTRRVSLPFAVTVTGNLELQRFHVLTLDRPLPSLSDDSEAAVTINRINKVTALHESFILITDLRNTWTRPLRALIDVHDPNDLSEKLLSINEVISPGHIKRLALPIPRLHVIDPRRPPSLNEHSQYVVAEQTEDKRSQDEILEQFWYKQELLKLVRGSWAEPDGTRSGALEFSKILLTPEMIATMRHARIGLSTQLFDGATDAQLPPATAVHPGQNLRLEACVQNRTAGVVELVVRLSARAAHAAADAALPPDDTARRLAWTGTFERRLYGLKPGAAQVLVWGLAPLASGQYLVRVDVDTAMPSRKSVSFGEARMKPFDAKHGRELKATSTIALDVGEETF